MPGITRATFRREPVRGVGPRWRRLGGGTAGMILQNRDHLRAVLAELKGVVVINFTNASAVLDRRPAPRRDCHD